MQISSNLYFTSATRPWLKLFGHIGCLVLVLFLFSCSSIPPAQRGTTSEEEDAPPPRYSMVFVIHGDGDYLYHDRDGNARKADIETLARAKRVAVRNRNAEVFIFHQKPGGRTLFFFPRRDGKMYYYRNGRMHAEVSYRRYQGQSRFDHEVKFYHQFRAEGQSKPLSMFLYYGHEVPEFDGTRYDASNARRKFTVHDLADGLHNFTRDYTKLDLLVLATCFNGTPYTIAALSPYARTIVASPDNLHLSYFALQPFEWLDIGLQDRDMPRFAKNFARQSFDRLNEDIQTTITIAVYDVDRVQGYVHAVDSLYDHALTSLSGKKQGIFEHIDCADDSTYVLPGIGEGVDILYRPPRFGRLRNKQNHSGWGCRVLPN
jgi:hypothetical protein